MHLAGLTGGATRASSLRCAEDERRALATGCRSPATATPYNAGSHATRGGSACRPRLAAVNRRLPRWPDPRARTWPIASARSATPRLVGNFARYRAGLGRAVDDAGVALWLEHARRRAPGRHPGCHQRSQRRRRSGDALAPRDERLPRVPAPEVMTWFRRRRRVLPLNRCDRGRAPTTPAGWRAHPPAAPTCAACCGRSIACARTQLNPYVHPAMIVSWCSRCRRSCARPTRSAPRSSPGSAPTSTRRAPYGFRPRLRQRGAGLRSRGVGCRALLATRRARAATPERVARRRGPAASRRRVRRQAGLLSTPIRRRSSAACATTRHADVIRRSSNLLVEDGVRVGSPREPFGPPSPASAGCSARSTSSCSSSSSSRSRTASAPRSR